MLYIFFNRLIFISIWSALDLGASEMRAMCFGPSQRISRLYTRYAGEWRSAAYLRYVSEEVADAAQVLRHTLQNELDAGDE